jgi:hypothetical protein
VFTSRSITALAVGALGLPLPAATAQSNVTVSPFASYVPSAAVNPLAGFGLTFGGTTGLALRSSAQLSISNPDSAARVAGGNRPWGADADVMLFLGGLGRGYTVFERTLNPYVFSGIFLMGAADSLSRNTTENGWSYGLGAAIPLGLHADLFGEARWRMPTYVLPTSDDAPDSKSEMRFGLSFHVGGAEPPPRRPAPRRRSYEEYEDEPVVQSAPAPAPAPQVIVVQPQPPTPPPATQVVVVQQPAPEPRRAVNINFPIVITPSRSRRSRGGHHVTVVQAPPPARVDTVLVMPRENSRPRRRP